MSARERLAAIEARAGDPFGTALQGIGQVDDDRDWLLSFIRQQDAQLDAVRTLANDAGRCGWRISADDIRKTLAAS